jgi:arylsulfatase A-like enzyme
MPGVIEAGSVCDTPAAGFDLFPTMIELAGIRYDDHAKPLDGASLAGLLKGKGGNLRRTLFWGTGGGNFAVRDGNWKLVRDKGVDMLFDLSSDPGEEHDLASENPRMVDKLNRKLKKWMDSVYSEVPDQLKGQ